MGNYDLSFCSLGADFHDPINFLEVLKHKEQSTNNTGVGE
jgi:ABC-type oligopeptide transport system substrate-binding subunit